MANMFNVGDPVVIQGFNAPRMIVTHIDDSIYLRCVWFNTKYELQSSVFASLILEHAPNPPKPKLTKPSSGGQIVY